MEPVDKKRHTERVIRSYYKDGLWDLFLSMVMMQFIFGPYLYDAGFGHFWSLAIFYPVYLIGWVLIRQIKIKIITPRLPGETFIKRKKNPGNPWTRWIHLMILAGLFAGIVVVWFWEKQSERWLFPAFLSGAFLVGFYMGGIFLNFTRLFYYGLLTGSAIIAGEILQQYYQVPYHGFPLMFTLVSAVMLCNGLILLIGFLKKYPAQFE